MMVVSAGVRPRISRIALTAILPVVTLVVVIMVGFPLVVTAVVIAALLVAVCTLGVGAGEAAGSLIIGVMTESRLNHQAAVVVLIMARRICKSPK